ncbi:MCE family protein [Pseudonocardia sp. CA-107938]|uniref:MCE family protein n=1 Tax=Pseudonocardia sp. CA-107938 TaxID=3240021 RepID=UPI003D8EA2BE
MIRYEQGSKLRYQVLGIVFLLVVALLVATAVGIYNKAFTSAVSVRLETDRIGSQLRPGADVKVRGVVVGEVRAVEPTSRGAALELALRPDRVELVPANVAARLLPKTLFGERYVALQLPDDPAAAAIADGDVIGQDRTRTAIEVEQVLDHVLPLLQAVEPDKLAVTLNALAEALDGRGAQLGDTLVALDSYLEKFAPSTPDLLATLDHLGPVSDTYAKAVPDLLTALADLTTTTDTFAEQGDQLREFYAEVTAASDDLGSFLDVNRENLIALSATSRSTLEVLARYAPEYPCLFRQLVEGIPAAETVFGKGSEHPQLQKITIEISAGRGKYRPGVDDPAYGDDRGPRCYDKAVPPGTFPQYPPGGPIEDGSTKPPPSRTTPDPDLLPGLGPVTPPTAEPAAWTSSSGEAERRLIALLMAPALGVMPADVPSWAGLLVGPLLRGTEVTLV